MFMQTVLLIAAEGGSDGHILADWTIRGHRRVLSWQTFLDLLMGDEGRCPNTFALFNHHDDSTNVIVGTVFSPSRKTYRRIEAEQ